MTTPTLLDAGHRATQSVRFVHRSAELSHSTDECIRARNGRRVLVLEDDVVSRQALQLLLEDEGLEVETLSLGHGALSKIRTASPAVLVLGLRSPSKESLVLARCGRELEPALPIIVMSSSEPFEYPLSALLALPGVEHLQKPIDFARLLQMIERLLARLRV